MEDGLLRDIINLKRLTTADGNLIRRDLSATCLASLTLAGGLKNSSANPISKYVLKGSKHDFKGYGQIHAVYEWLKCVFLTLQGLWTKSCNLEAGNTCVIAQ